MGGETDVSNHHFDVSRRGFKHLTSTREALKTLTSRLPENVLEIESIPLSSALHRVLGEDLYSPIDVPAFDRAAMDGYAVRAEDTYSASVSSPILLRVVGETSVPGMVSMRKGEASLVVTGGQMPQGADAVVMIEYGKQSSDGAVEVSTEVHPAENVSRIGEDVRKGTLVLKAGQRLLPQDLGMLVCLGFDRVRVKRRPKIAVLSTGNEIHDGPSASSGKVPDVNRPTLLNAVRELGCEPIDLGIAADEFDAIHGKLKQAIASADIILVTAGTSVGPRDFVPQVINGLGKPGLLVHGVAMRPSMPTGLGIIDGKPIFSLPGYPVSAYLAFLEFIPPLVDHLLGTKALPTPVVRAKLARRVTGVLGSRTYIRVRVVEHEESVYAEPVSVSGAGILSSLVRSNGFIIVPENVEGYEEGEMVEVELFRPVESGNATT
jgi:molybdenum cofactor synthesis domain-containing protein